MTLPNLYYIIIIINIVIIISSSSTTTNDKTNNTHNDDNNKQTPFTQSASHGAKTHTCGIQVIGIVLSLLLLLVELGLVPV